MSNYDDGKTSVRLLVEKTQGVYVVTVMDEVGALCTIRGKDRAIAVAKAKRKAAEETFTEVDKMTFKVSDLTSGAD